MKGTVAVGGMALSPACLFLEGQADISARHVEDTGEELRRLRTASALCAGELSALIEDLRRGAAPDQAEILDFQLLLLEDDNYMGRIVGIVQGEGVNCEYAVACHSRLYREELAALDNPYLNERVADISDIEQRLLRALSRREKAAIPSTPVIAVAQDLTPSQVVELGHGKLEGIILEKGGLSSHCVILARSMGIPCIIGAAGVLARLEQGQPVLLDAEAGEVLPSPDEEATRRYRQYQEEKQRERQSLERFRQGTTATADGRTMRVYANITSQLEVPGILEQGGEGVGLLRTEMLYMERDTPPDEETQFALYSAIVQGLAGRPLIVRTLDVGGDKSIPYLSIPPEENPFLGYRAIRYCLDHPEIFKPQIAAILRAAALGPVRLMLPMVAAAGEVERAKEIIATVREELEDRGAATGPLPVGIMVETPAAAVVADQLAGLVDFFSIGTNDLTQYLFAADRNNARVASLNSYFQPALLRMVERVCRCAREKGIEVGICGQAGEVEQLIPLWVGMGVDELSVSIPSIPRVRRRISGCDTAACKELVGRVLEYTSEAEVRKEVERWS